MADLQYRTWHSGVYSHFVMPPAVVEMGSAVIGYKFVCQKCVIIPSVLHLQVWFVLIYPTFRSTRDPSKYVMCSCTDESTSNLLCHVNACDDSDSNNSVISASNFDLGWPCYLVGAWSACCAWPHTIIEDNEFHEILTMLYTAIKIHSHQTVSCDISDMYEHSRIAIALHLQSVEHCLHIELDGWTAPDVFSFLGVTVWYFEKGHIRGFVLDFIK